MEGFNIRVYAICIKDNKIFTLTEGYAGTVLTKLPGGGLEFGEGTIECIHREFEEELNLKVEILEHFYTQESFQTSLINDNKQIFCVYYLVKILNLEEMEIRIPKIEKVSWNDLGSENPFTLPVDKIVFEKLKKVATNSGFAQ